MSFTEDEQNEIDSIKDELSDNEQVEIVAKQSRLKPGGTIGFTPNTIFVTSNRIIIKNPSMFGARKDVEMFYYADMVSVKLEKGMFSSSIYLSIPGLTEISKAQRGGSFGLASLGGVANQSGSGLITGLPKDTAKKMYDIIRKHIDEAKLKKNAPPPPAADNLDPIKALKMKFVNGEITQEEYEAKKKILEE